RRAVGREGGLGERADSLPQRQVRVAAARRLGEPLPCKSHAGAAPGRKAMDSALLSLISACTALVASIAGPFVTLIVAKRNFNATVSSRHNGKTSGTRDSARSPQPGLLEKVQRLVLAQTKIRLLLNPNEADHRE